MTGDASEAIFHEVPQGTSCAFQDAYVKQNLAKWDMWKNMQFHQFRYTKAYHKMAAVEFLIDLFNDPNVQSTLKVVKKRDSWEPVKGVVKSVTSETVLASLTRMDLFERLGEADSPIVRGNNAIMKCMEEVVDGFTISDQLREMLLKGEESENCELFSEDEQAEFLFRIFRHIALGGSMNQYEDDIEPYLDIAKKLYKEMLSVHKNPAGKVEVVSPVYIVSAVDSEEGWDLFPTASTNNFCYVTMDPMRRMCRIWYHAFLPYW